MLAAAGLVQMLAGWALLVRFVRRPAAAPRARPPVTILKPLCGLEPGLEQALLSFFRQDYPDFQIVFGVRDPADPALPLARALAQGNGHGRDIAVVQDATLHGQNRKVSNLINMLPAARHDVLVIADSDVHAAPDYLDRIVADLERPGVGLVSLPFTGMPTAPALAARLGASETNHVFIPGVMLARALGRQDCLGPTMALRREVLERIGGLGRLADRLADDNWLGQFVRAEGLAVVLGSAMPACAVPETTLAALFQHELRWARTIRTLVPLEYAASALQHPLFWAALAAALAGGAGWSLALFALAWALRAAAARGIDRALRLAFPAPVWLLPLRDLVSMAVFLASYAGRGVVWRGHRLQAR